MVRQSLVILLLVLLTVGGVAGWRRRFRIRIGRRPPDVHNHNHHHVNTNNCMCNTVILSILDRLGKLEKKVGRRDVADLLDLEEDYPGFENLLDHLDTKRDGNIDKEALTALLKRSPSARSSMTNICHCGRSVVDDFNMGLL